VEINRDDIGAQEQQAHSEVGIVSALAILVSMASFAWFYRLGDILLYGDAVAHLNIARRILDARDPGFGQIGTVWLPLPHLLIAPFVANDHLWQTGIGGSIPSMAAYVLGVAGIFRLVRARASLAAASLAAAIYGLNPSMLYMQSTAMTESIFLASVIWAIVYYDEYLRGLAVDPPGVLATLPVWRALERCGLCLAAAIFTRYDGWIIAFIVGLCAIAAALRWRVTRPPKREVRRLQRSMLSFLLLLALCPTLWLAHNYFTNYHPLDWLNGPYSAKAIEQRSSPSGYPPYPGKYHPIVAAEYFLKAARMNTGEGSRETWLVLLATAGLLFSAFRLRRFGAMLLLWIPLPFYALSVAYGSVPIFVPEWWPYSYYNVRYGLELLPAIAVFVALLPWGMTRFLHRRVAIAATVGLWLVVLLAFDSSSRCLAPRSQNTNWGRRWMIPICYREAYVNSRGRLQLETQLAKALDALPHDATVMMYTSDYVGALQQSGFHLNRVVSENVRFVWDAALSAPFAGADYVIAIAGDPVAEAVRVNPRGLTKVTIFHTLGKPEVILYRCTRP
jgi:hypothetical protein